MAAGFVSIHVKDGDGTLRSAKYWSSDGTTNGTLTPAHQMLGDDGGVLAGQAGDVAWDGVAASPSWTALYKYMATKLEAMRAILASQAASAFGYEACPANATTLLGGAGAVGDLLATVHIIPSTTAPGDVSIKDGSNAAIVIFKGGAGITENDLKPITVQLRLLSTVGGWSIVTGANVTVLAAGDFT
jgi:hypothetical protein